MKTALLTVLVSIALASLAAGWVLHAVLVTNPSWPWAEDVAVTTVVVWALWVVIGLVVLWPLTVPFEEEEQP